MPTKLGVIVEERDLKKYFFEPDTKKGSKIKEAERKGTFLMERDKTIQKTVNFLELNYADSLQKHQEVV